LPAAAAASGSAAAPAGAAAAAAGDGSAPIAALKDDVPADTAMQASIDQLQRFITNTQQCAGIDSDAPAMPPSRRSGSSSSSSDNEGGSSDAGGSGSSGLSDIVGADPDRPQLTHNEILREVRSLLTVPDCVYELHTYCFESSTALKALRHHVSLPICDTDENSWGGLPGRPQLPPQEIWKRVQGPLTIFLSNRKGG
jgi:hypothetical protein